MHVLDGQTWQAGTDLLVTHHHGAARVLRRWTDGAFVIGRECPPSNLRIAHPGISRLHARVVPGARWRLIDYDSLNGCYLSGWRLLGDAEITDGMTVHLGAPDGVAITFHYVPRNPWDARWVAASR